MVSIGRGLDVDAARRAAGLAKGAHQGLAEVAGAAGDQDRHRLSVIRRGNALQGALRDVS